MRASFLTASAVLLLCTTTTAAAQDAREKAVSYGDLDLTRDEGVARLERRVRSAVRSVCFDDERTLKAQVRERSCIKTARTTASEHVARAVSRAQQAQARSNVGATIPIVR